MYLFISVTTFVLIPDWGCFLPLEQEHVPCSSRWVGLQTPGWWLGLDCCGWGPHFHWFRLLHTKNPLHLFQRDPRGLRGQLQWNSMGFLYHASCHVCRRWVDSISASVGKESLLSVAFHCEQMLHLRDLSQVSCFILLLFILRTHEWRSTHSCQWFHSISVESCHSCSSICVHHIHIPLKKKQWFSV